MSTATFTESNILIYSVNLAKSTSSLPLNPTPNTASMTIAWLNSLFSVISLAGLAILTTTPLFLASLICSFVGLVNFSFFPTIITSELYPHSWSILAQAMPSPPLLPEPQTAIIFLSSSSLRSLSLINSATDRAALSISTIPGMPSFLASSSSFFAPSLSTSLIIISPPPLLRHSHILWYPKSKQRMF